MSKFDAVLKKIEEALPVTPQQQQQAAGVQPNSANATQQQTNSNQATNSLVKTSTGQDPAKVAQNTGFSLTDPNTAKAMQALADTETMADVTKVLSDSNVQKILQGFIANYKV